MKPSVEGENLHFSRGLEDQFQKKSAVLELLQDAFPSASLEQIFAAYNNSNGDANAAAGILGGLEDNEYPSCSNSSSFDHQKSAKNFKGRKQKRVSASTGMVSNFLGKGYSSSRGKNVGDSPKVNKHRLTKIEVNKEGVKSEDAEEFLCSMLGDGCGLNMGVVRDVFGQCGYDVEKSLDTLLDLSASSFDQFKDDNKICGDDSTVLPERSLSYQQDDMLAKYKFADEILKSAFHLSTEEAVRSAAYGYRDSLKAPLDTEGESSSSSGTTKENLQQRVLESLFNIPESTTYEPKIMNWKKVVEKMVSFGDGLGFHSSSIAELPQSIGYAKGDEYQVLRKAASHNWDMMKSYYQRAATAYSKGERGHAAYLSEQGKLYEKMAKEADEKASMEIFEVRNRGIKNAVTIDLHGQHVKQAIGLLKRHLLLFSYIPSIQFLKVITGSSTHGVGSGKLKRSVINLAEKEGIEWSEENSGVVVLRIDGLKDLNFAKSDSDSE